LKKWRNQLWRSGTKTFHTRTLLRRDPSTGKWQRLEWDTLVKLYEEDRARFPVLNYLTHDHLVCLFLLVSVIPFPAGFCRTGCWFLSDRLLVSITSICTVIA
jgi:hypothetical protein